MNEGKETQKRSLRHMLLTALGTVLCVILIPILVLNVSLIVKSYLHEGEVPNVGGVFPLIVLTDSMYPEIQSGDLIFCRTAEPDQIQVGDVIAFFDPAGSGTSIVTHSVAEVMEKDGQIEWITRGIANNADDPMPVPEANLVGMYRRRVPGLGNAVMFMQTTAGLIVCVVCPILLLVGWEVMRRRRYERRKQADTDALMRELQELRAQKEKQSEDGTNVP